jgi:hypothetical protein
MRLASVIAALILALRIGTTLAAVDKPVKTEEPEWHWDLTGARATYAEVEPNNSCVTAQPMACGDIIDPAQIDVAGDYDYYSFQGTAGLPITIGTDASDLCDPDAGDTYIYLYDQNCSVLAQDDDSGPGLYSLISSYNPTYTGTFYAVVRHYGSSGTGCYKLFVNCAPPATGACCFPGPICEVMTQSACATEGGTYQGDNTVCVPNPCPYPPWNDTCVDPVELLRCSSGQTAATLTNASNNYSPTTGGCTGYTANGKDVVYVATLVAGDLLHLVYTTPAYDGSIYVVTDCSDVAGTCVVGEDDPEPETIDWIATADGTYYIIADAYTYNGGADFTLEWTISCPPPMGACCLDDQGNCQVMTEAECLGQNGQYQGDNTLCAPNPCPIVPGRDATWGQIKAGFRPSLR